MKSIDDLFRHAHRARRLSLGVLAAFCLATLPIAGCSDDDTRSDVDEAIEEVRDEAGDAADEIRKKAEEVEEEIRDEIDDAT